MNEENFKLEVDCQTGLVAKIPLSEEEIHQKQIDRIEAEKMASEREDLQNRIAMAKEAAINKFIELGLSKEDAELVVNSR